MDKEVLSAFESIDGEVPSTLIKKCIDICHEFDLKATELAAKWDALKYAKRDSSDVVRDEQLNEVRDQLVAKRAKHGAKGQQRAALAHSATPVKTLTKASLEQFDGEEDSFRAAFGISLGGMSSPARTPMGRKRIDPNTLTTPEPRLKKVSILSPSIEASPAQSQDREDSGTILFSFNKDEVARAVAGERRDIARRVKTEIIGPIGASMRYMFEDMEEKRDGLNAMIENMGRLIAQANRVAPEEKAIAVKLEIEEKKDMNDEEAEQPGSIVYRPVGVPNQESVIVCGRICAEGVNKLHPSGIHLCGDRSLSNGAMAKLRLGQLKTYAFFPGQLAALKGINNSGTGMVVEELLKPAILPHSSLPADTVTRMTHGLNGEPLSIFVAAGPFTHSSNLLYMPLNDLLTQVQLVKPDVLILLGPFLDANHADVKAGKMNRSYQDFVHSLMCDIIEKTHDVATKIIIVPSADDVQWDNVLPQRPAEFIHELPDGERLMRLPNPATVRINDVTFGIVNTDVILQLGNAELTFNKEGERLNRLANHLVKQHSYYPLFPPAGGDCVDFGHFERILFPSVTPDILITPSKILRYSAHHIGNDVLYVNPAAVAKGANRGTYAHISIHPRKDEEIVVGEDGLVTQHFIASRTRVDLVRV